MAHFGNTRNSLYYTHAVQVQFNHDSHIDPDKHPPQFVAHFLPIDVETKNPALVAASHEKLRAVANEHAPHQSVMAMQVVQQVYPNASCARAEHIARETKPMV